MVLAIVHPFGLTRLILAGELVSVELTYEILCGGAAEGTSRVDVADKHPLLLVSASDLHLHKVGTLPHTTMVAISLTEGTLIFPVLEIGRGEYLHLLTHGKNHVPESRLLVPKDVRVAEVARGRGYDGVVLIFGEGLAAVGAVGHALCLAWACRSIESHYGAVAIARRIVFINDTRPAEDGAQSVAE